MNHRQGNETSCSGAAENETEDDGERRDAIANAIHTYRRNRDAYERDRSERERTTITVLAFTAIFALLAAGAGITTVIVTHQDTEGIIAEAQRSSNQQHADTLMALGKTDAQISEMKGQAEAMHGQLAIAKAQLRPRMRFDSSNIKIEDGLLKVTAMWVNIGSTDAVDFMGWNKLDQVESLPPPDSLKQRPDSADRIAPSIVEPTLGLAFPTESLPIADIFSDVIAQRKFIVWYGYGEYREVFPDAPLHHRRWCYVILFERAAASVRPSMPVQYSPLCSGTN